MPADPHPMGLQHVFDALGRVSDCHAEIERAHAAAVETARAEHAGAVESPVTESTALGT